MATHEELIEAEKTLCWAEDELNSMHNIIDQDHLDELLLRKREAEEKVETLRLELEGAKQ